MFRFSIWPWLPSLVKQRESADFLQYFGTTIRSVRRNSAACLLAASCAFQQHWKAINHTGTADPAKNTATWGRNSAEYLAFWSVLLKYTWLRTETWCTLKMWWGRWSTPFLLHHKSYLSWVIVVFWEEFTGEGGGPGCYKTDILLSRCQWGTDI